ncbi:TPA: restriction endonuclease [Candidatus Woesearchaeota archaeon]|nr:restriction endonuclease [Candidatus Woesearchaeota archaeon]HIH39683.1 restriction endonuclease [Candidatus Woesearchaeota archaeon]
MFEINSIEELEKLSEKVTWQYFERLVAFIFEKNDYEVQQNVVLTKDKERRQFDVIAKKDDITYLIECKRWKSRAGVVSAIQDAVDIHLERGKFYSELFPEEQAYPLLVMPLQGMPEQHQDVFIVPLLSLNWFLNNA